MQEKEKRRFNRVQKTLYVQCRQQARDVTWSSATIQDISESGISIVAARAFTAGDVLETRITTFLKPQPISVLGKVVSCEEERIVRVKWITHISFIDINKEDKLSLHELVQIFLKKQIERK